VVFSDGTRLKVSKPVALQPEVENLITAALAEDIGSGDLTTEAVVQPGRRARAAITQKQAGMIFGLEVAEVVFRRLHAEIAWRVTRRDGAWLHDPPATVAELEGDARALLTGERVALNFLQRLSGIATATAEAVAILEGSGVEVLDTRKTTPGMRALEKAAVAAGGGRNHRMGLYDAILIKENHIAIAGGVGAAIRLALERRPEGVPVEVECRTPAEVEEALSAGAERILLDNMTPAELAGAVELIGGRAVTEASGGISLQNLKQYRKTGVNFVSMGSLTHSYEALDLSLTVVP
jgi:nicotinate-nucleotide pyrophosphorylase (carboxylating)